MADDTLSGLANTVAEAMLRAASNNDEFKRMADSEDLAIAVRPWITAGGWIVYAKGKNAGQFLANVGGGAVGNG